MDGENCVLRRAFSESFFQCLSAGFSFFRKVFRTFILCWTAEGEAGKNQKKFARMKGQIFFVNFRGSFFKEKLWKFLCSRKTKKCKWKIFFLENCDCEISISQGCWGGGWSENSKFALYVQLFIACVCVKIRKVSRIITEKKIWLQIIWKVFATQKQWRNFLGWEIFQYGKFLCACWRI